MNQTNRLSGHLKVAMEGALEAGAYFRSRLHTDKDVKTKSSPSDLVTDVDPHCEALIRQRIAIAFPHHSILGEETTAPGAEASAQAAASVVGEEALWIVDPLDGTTNFVYSIPLSTVSIGYAEAGVIQVGVISDPYRDELFYAVRGAGAWRASTAQVQAWCLEPTQSWPGQVLQATTVETLADSVVAAGFPTRAAAREQTIEAGIRMTGQLKSLRALGSAALHLAYVAAGRLDAFWEYDLNAWDLAAGMLMVSEAGGCTESLAGEPYHLRARDIVAAGTRPLAAAIRAVVYDALVPGCLDSGEGDPA